jgi:hypothetical protein
MQMLRMARPRRQKFFPTARRRSVGAELPKKEGSAMPGGPGGGMGGMGGMDF